MTTLDVDRIIALNEGLPIHERLRALIGWRDTTRSLGDEEACRAFSAALSKTIDIIDGMRDTVLAHDKLTMIRLWRFQDAPLRYRELSAHGGDEDWVMYVPDGCNADTYRLEQAIGICDTSVIAVAGGMVYIGAHA